MIRFVLLCMLEAVDGGLCLFEVVEVAEVMRCVILCMLEVVDGRLYLLGRVLCMLKAAEGELCLLQVLEASEVLDVLEVWRRCPVRCSEN